MKPDKYLYILFAVLACMVVVYENGRHIMAKAQENAVQPIVVSLDNSRGEEIGEATLSETKKGVQIKLEAEGLSPGIHAIHFHEKGLCEPPDFQSAGPHFNPYGKEHGLDNPRGPHAGDMQNIFADKNGNVKTTIYNARVTLKKGKKNSLQDADGSALVIHEKGDDQKTNPSGNSGNRVACGVIK